MGKIEVREQVVVIDYTNYRGKRMLRRVRPIRLVFDSNQWHPKPEWLLEAFDLDKNAERTFSLKDIHSWKPAK
ncbi:hypothetical protein CR956_00115 [Candidatus Saccharibacteria bacterium]|nr:MAG: hypothetical protein CR956_00115 [Candidatus Saccharibacteria bacterium]